MPHWKHVFARKDLEMLLAEAAGEHRLHRVLGPVALTSLGIGCIIGAGIFVLTGVAAADDGGPAIILSFAVAAIGCTFAALCYAEFAAMAPVAGSVYTYAYTTLGEIFAWIIGWDIILEYSMGCATVASSWSGYLNEFLGALGIWQVPPRLALDPFSKVEGTISHGLFNLPAVIIMVLVTTVLVLGIRESARTNAVLVAIKVVVVLFVIAVGWAYVRPENWTGVPVTNRVLPQERVMPQLVKDFTEQLTSESRIETLTRQLAASYRVHWAKREVGHLQATGELSSVVARVVNRIVERQNALDLPKTPLDRAITQELLPHIQAKGEVNPEIVAAFLDRQFKDEGRTQQLIAHLAATSRLEWAQKEAQRLEQEEQLTSEDARRLIATVETQAKPNLPHSTLDRAAVTHLLPQVRAEGEKKAARSWGLLGSLGLNKWLLPIDDATRTPFTPYGLSGIMLGAAIVFFAYIGFDSISTHAEEARHPQRDVPIGILVSLGLCTLLYMAVAAVVTGMVPYHQIDARAPIADAFAQRYAAEPTPVLRLSTAIISAGGLAGMTSVLLVLFLSQARVFMAMARDGLLPEVFGRVHPRFRTPHIATITTGFLICIVAALTPIRKLAEMVNIGTLLAFVMVCAAVMILRIQRPNAHRPFRCPALFVFAPLGILVNLALMLFLPLDTWARLLFWLGVGLVIYFFYSRTHSHLTQHLLHEIQMPRDEQTGTSLDPEVAGE